MILKSVKLLACFSILLCCKIAAASSQDPSTDSEWLLSNIAHHQYTALIEIGTGYRQNRYNPFSYFKPLSTYRYPAKVVDVFEGDKTISSTCIIQSLESKAATTTDLTGRRIVSFNKIDNCIVIDVGVYPLATPTLIQIAEKKR